jgi:hypothetical protein
VRPLKRIWVLQCSPWGGWPARAGQIPAMCRRSSAGEGKGGSYGSLALGFVGRTGTRRLRPWGAPAASGAGRRGWQCRRPGPLVVSCRWAASCCGARVGAEDPWGAGVSGGGAAPAASSLAAVADGVGLRPEQGGDGLIGNECRGAPACTWARPWPSRRRGAQGLGRRARQGGTTVTTGPTAVRPAGWTRGTVGILREEGGLQGALGRSTPREARGTDA